MRTFILIAFPAFTLGVVLWGAFWPYNPEQTEPSDPLEKEALEQTFE